MKQALQSGGAVALMMLLMVSCAPRRSEIALSTEQVPASRLLSLVDSTGKKLRSVVGRGSMSFESPEMAGSMFFNLSLKKPDSLLVRFQGPFGIDVGSLFLSRQKFVVYNSMENHVITGIPSAHAIQSVIPFDLTYDEIISAFAGDFSITQDLSAMQRYAIDDDHFFLSFRCGDHRCDYWIDPAHLMVTKYQVRDGNEKVVMEAVASSVKEQDDLRAPRGIVITFPAEHRRLSIYYSTLTLNSPNTTFTYSIPPSARTTVQ